MVEVTSPGKVALKDTSASGSVTLVRSTRPSRITRSPARRSEMSTPAASLLRFASWGSSAKLRSAKFAWEPTYPSASYGDTAIFWLKPTEDAASNWGPVSPLSRGLTAAMMFPDTLSSVETVIAA